MSKLDHIVSYLRHPDNQGLGNRALTLVFECDEALIRRARKLAENADLRAENDVLATKNRMLEAEISSLQARVSVLEAIKPRPRTKKVPVLGNQLFFWETHDGVVSTVSGPA